MRLKKSEFEVLEALYRYRYLTNSQIGLLPISVNHPQRVQATSRALVNLGLVEKLVPPLSKMTAQPMNVENMYCLKSRGLRELAGMRGVPVENLDYRCGGSISGHDYFHRKMTVSFHILVDLALRGSPFMVDDWKSYFDRSNKMRNNSKHLIPDSLFSIAAREKPSDRVWYCLEVTR